MQSFLFRCGHQEPRAERTCKSELCTIINLKIPSFPAGITSLPSPSSSHITNVSRKRFSSYRHATLWCPWSGDIMPACVREAINNHNTALSQLGLSTVKVLRYSASGDFFQPHFGQLSLSPARLVWRRVKSLLYIGLYIGGDKRWLVARAGC